MRIYLDFDGTVVEHYFPAIGAENPNALKVIAKLQSAGHQIILNTYRVEIDIVHVHEAMEFINSSALILEPITIYLPKKLDPKPFDLVVAKESNQLYIDDIAPNIPIRRNLVLEYGMMVDWLEVEKILGANGIL
jgi:predicted mannosyl-3-phosphoglycerate phosphatase (HAD superfamily)